MSDAETGKPTIWPSDVAQALAIGISVTLPDHWSLIVREATEPFKRLAVMHNGDEVVAFALDRAAACRFAALLTTWENTL
jgi:hypothetical protein